MTSQQTVDIVMAALCCWREASSEIQEVRIGVLWVMRNRMMAHWVPQNTFQDVAEEPWQFSSMSSRPFINKEGKLVWDPNLTRWPPSTEGAWLNCLSMAEAVVTNQIADPTGGATFYHDTSMPGPPSGWGPVTETVKIGRIVFYRRG